MSKYFVLTKNIVDGTTYWFWYREGISTLNNNIYDLLTDKENYWDIRFPFALALFVPFMYIFFAFYIPAIYKKQACQKAKDGGYLIMYNKRNIEYLKIMTALSTNE